ncbi:MAG: hypothetical protein ACP5KG_02800 [Myxococcota bacterium]
MISGIGLARECPSKLNAHNFDITDTLSLGAEVRLFYLGVDVGENLPKYMQKDRLSKEDCPMQLSH